MAFTRFKYDKSRVDKQLTEETFTARYMLNTPGNGTAMPFQEDPHTRLQMWGANFAGNALDVENDLMGITRPLNRDCLKDEYKKKSTPIQTLHYSTTSSHVSQSRVETPAWEVRSVMPDRGNFLFYNPQEHVDREFQNNLNTRMLQKDMYKHGNHLTRVSGCDETK